MMTISNDEAFKEFLLTGTLGIINRNIYPGEVIVSCGDPLQVREEKSGIDVLKTLDYGDLQITFLNNRLYLLNIEIPHSKSSDWYIPKIPGCDWLSEIRGKTYEETKAYVFHSKLKAYRLTSNLTKNDSSQLIEMENSGVQIAFSANGVIESLDYAPDKPGKYDRQPL